MKEENFSHEVERQPFHQEPEESSCSLANKIFGITALYFGNAFVGTAVFATILPTQIFDIVGEEKKEITLSLVGLLGSIGSIVATPIFGALSDKTNFKFGKRRAYLLVGVPLSAIFFMSLSLFTSSHWINVAMLVILLLLCQIGTAAVLGPYGGLLPDLIPKEKQGIASGIQALGLSLGTLGGSILVAIVLESVSPKWKYFAAYGFACSGFLIPSLYTIFGLKEKYIEDIPKEVEEELPFQTKLIQGLTKTFYFPCEVYHNFYLVATCTFILFLGLNLMGPFVQYLVRDILHVDKPVLVASLAIMTFVIATAIGSVIGGFFSDKIGPKIVAFIFVGFILLGYILFLIILILVYDSIAAGILFFVCYFIIGFGFGGSMAATNVLTLNSIPKDTVARDFAIAHQMLSLGQIAGTLIGGQILGWVKAYSIRLAYIVLMCFTILCFIVSLIVMFFIKIDFKGSWREDKLKKYETLDETIDIQKNDISEI